MKKIEISIKLSITNGEWEPGKKISEEWSREHVVDLDTINDENVFQQAKDFYFGEFQRALEKRLNTCIQRMLDGGRSDKEEAEKSADTGMKLEP